MSDGMSDGYALGRLDADIREAAHVLKDALQANEHGCRGLKTNPLWTVNQVLEIFDIPYRLVKLNS